MSDVVAEAKAALAGVTDGPWVVDQHEDTEYDTLTVGAGEYLTSPGGYTSTDLILEVDTYSDEIEGTDYAQRLADAEFIAAARTLVPELVAEVERQRHELDDAARRIRAFATDCVTYGDMTPAAKRHWQVLADTIAGKKTAADSRQAAYIAALSADRAKHADDCKTPCGAPGCESWGCER